MFISDNIIELCNLRISYFSKIDLQQSLVNFSLQEMHHQEGFVDELDKPTMAWPIKDAQL